MAEQTLRVLRVVENIAPAAAVILAAINYIWWTPLSIGVGISAMTYRLSLGLDAKLVTAHEIIIELNAVLKWWRGLSTTERCDPDNLDKLVFNTERAILRTLSTMTSSGGVVTSFRVQDSTSESDASTDEDDDCGASMISMTKHGPLQATGAGSCASEMKEAEAKA